LVASLGRDPGREEQERSMTLTARSGIRRLAAVALAGVFVLGAVGTASATTPSGAGRGVPLNQISVQLFNFFVYIGFDQTPAAQARQEEVLRRVAEMGYRNVEPVDYTNFQGLGAADYRALLDKYGLKASALHTSLSMATTDQQWLDKLALAKTIGARFIGAGADPQTFTTAAEWVAWAQKIDHFGFLARQQGMRYMVHSHNWEFTQVYGGKTAYDILQENTDAQNVVFELDLYWATKAGVDPIDVLNTYGKRIQLLHVKDMAPDGSITTVGEGIIDFPPIFAAAGAQIRYYVIERDPPFTDPTFDPFTPTQKGFDYLMGVTY
jgi:sugar phosphate isomerase/epimerase